MGTLDRPSSGTRAGHRAWTSPAMSDRELAALRATRIGFVFQQFFLAEHATALENVADGLLYAGVPVAERREQAAEVLAAVGLGDRLGAGRPSSPAASASASRSPAPSSGGRRSCSPTSRRATSTARRAPRSSSCSTKLHADGATIAVITHDRDLAAGLPRRVEMLDGRIVDRHRAERRPMSRPQLTVRLALIGRCSAARRCSRSEAGRRAARRGGSACPTSNPPNALTLAARHAADRAARTRPFADQLPGRAREQRTAARSRRRSPASRSPSPRPSSGAERRLRGAAARTRCWSAPNASGSRDRPDVHRQRAGRRLSSSSRHPPTARSPSPLVNTASGVPADDHAVVAAEPIRDRRRPLRRSRSQATVLDADGNPVAGRDRDASRSAPATAPPASGTAAPRRSFAGGAQATETTTRRDRDLAVASPPTRRAGRVHGDRHRPPAVAEPASFALDNLAGEAADDLDRRSARRS